MKKMMFIAAIALCAMSCGNKAANAEEAAEEAVVEEVVVEEAPVAEEEATLVDTINAVVDGAAEVAENVMEHIGE